MLRSILDLDDVEVREVMTHRRNVETIDADLSAPSIVERVLASPYTRIPLWQGKPDNIVGVLHAKAVLRAVRSAGADVSAVDIRSIAAKPWFTPETTSLLQQLQAFRDRREHFALVVDEYGALMGVITLEDIIEDIVGEIADAHDVPVSGVRAQQDGSYVVAGTVTIRDLNREFDWSLPDEDAATIAGLLLHESRHIPRVGQIFNFYGFRFEVLRRQRNQILSILIRPPADAISVRQP
jgi:Mg2+/Co2+ transporter CorB